MKRTYDDIVTRKEIESPKADAFLDDLFELFKKHDISISHEDNHGGFILENYDKGNEEWMEGASINFKPAE